MREELELIADDEQIKMMNEEYKKLGIGVENAQKEPQNTQTAEVMQTEKEKSGSSVAKSSMLKVPYPIYMQSECYRYCELCELVGGIINNLDRRYFEKNKKYLEYIYKQEDKNSIYVKALGNLSGEIRTETKPMPLGQALKNLISIMTNQIMLLDRILSYDKSENSKEIRLNQLGATACMQSLFLLGI